jgi:hypothetical protein
MFIKHSILTGIVIALVLLFIATRHYPGGSQHDANSVGFDWRNNYLSNLFSVKAVNGADNTSRPWAVAGMFFLCASFGLFFIDFSNKIPQKSAAGIIRYFGAAAMLFAFLAVTPYHDIMVTIADTMALVSIFYITVFVFKSKLLFFKFLSVTCLLVLYTANYVYYTSNYLEILPVLQKASLLLTISWVLGLQYFTAASDFQSGG